MTIIRVHPIDLHAAARGVQQLSRGPLSDVAQALGLIMSGVEAAWVSGAATDFRHRGQSIVTWVRAAQLDLAQTGAYLDNAAGAFEDLEGALARAAGGTASTPAKPPGLARSVRGDETASTYVIVSGDTLWGISQRYGTTVEALRAANGITGSLIYPGQTLFLPSPDAPEPQPEPDPAGIVTVRSGDTLWGIAIAHGITVAQLMKANGLSGTLIYPGQRLRLPGTEAGPDTPPAPMPGGSALLLGSAYISGYAWLSHPGHYAIDLNTPSADKTLRAPYPAALIVADACPALTANGSSTGQMTPGTPTSPANNWGYGAMAVVETRYEDLNADQLKALTDRGARLEPGQSLYMMTAHLRPDQVPAAGASLKAGDPIATMGTSGNSTGPHVHVEVAVANSGLRPGAGQNSASFWIGAVVGVSNGSAARGRRIDPTPLFVGP